MYGVGWFLARCWISHQLFLPQMCSVHWGRWTTLPIRWARQNCEILIMVFGIKFNLFTYQYHYVTWNISASWKFFYRSWFQHYTVTVWDAGTCLCLLCRHVHSQEKHISPLPCPSICLFTKYQHDFLWMYFCEIWCRVLFSIYVRKIGTCLTLDRNFGHFTWRPKNILLLPVTSVCHNSIVVKHWVYL